MGAAVAGGVGDGGIHGDVTQPHAGHPVVVHRLDEHRLQALKHLQHLRALHRPAGLVDPVLLVGNRGRVRGGGSCIRTCPARTPVTASPEGAGPTHLRELDLALVRNSWLGGCVAPGEQAVAGAHKDHVRPLHWLQRAARQLIAYPIAQGAPVGVHLAGTGGSGPGSRGHMRCPPGAPSSLTLCHRAVCPARGWAQGSKNDGTWALPSGCLAQFGGRV